MSKTSRNIKLTDDPLTNIYIMVPMLNNREREAVSHLMYGCLIGATLKDTTKDASNTVLAAGQPSRTE